MSRTYRRKNFMLLWWIACEPCHQIDPATGVCFRAGDRPLRGKALARALARWCADGGYSSRPPKIFRRRQQRIYRNKARADIGKYLRDPDHEVMILARPCLPYWD